MEKANLSGLQKWALPGIALLALGVVSGCVSVQRGEPAGVTRALQSGPRDFLERAVVGPGEDGAYIVPTTQVVKSAGQTVQFPGRPVGVALHPQGKLAAVKNDHAVVFIDSATRAILQTLPLPKGGMSFCGILWSADGNTLWVTAAERALYGARADAKGQYAWSEDIDLSCPNKRASAPGGLAFDQNESLLYVALSSANALGVVDLTTRTLAANIPVGVAPYDVRVIGRKAYVTNWGGRQPKPGDLTGPTGGSKAVIDKAGVACTGSVSVIDLDKRSVLREIAVDLHPSGMAYAPSNKRLYVANANSDTVSVIDTVRDEVVARWIARPMKQLPFGSAPNALAVSPDCGKLFVALAGNNCVAVLDTATGAVTGLIPTDWYPGAVALSGDGQSLYVANVKGVGSRYQNPEEAAKRLGEYLGRDVKPTGFYNSHYALGSVSLIPMPDEKMLNDYTYEVAVNMRLPYMDRQMRFPQAKHRVTPVPQQPGETSAFKHVFYIIKENRTYDQIFGDMPQGDGDPKLCHFGRDVTPNHHALADEFVLLDNLYCNGVLSADGHQWTDEGFVTDYLEKSFGEFIRSYPYDGDDAMAYASSGFIWDHVLAKGLSFRDYGEMVKPQISPGTATWSDIHKDHVEGTHNVKIQARTEVHGLEPYLCPDYIGFPGKMQDIYRADIFLREFRQFEQDGKLPNFVIMLLPNDHTSGTREGMPTPRASVADNDLALGRIVEAISHSRYWAESAIFVVEDDPQAGLDHVDGHRTVSLCVSPYTKRRAVDHTHYTQSSILRTIELIFGLAPMTQFTLGANPMYGAFNDTPDLTPYDAKPNIIAIDEMNPPRTALHGKQRYYAQKSMEMPLDEVDCADEGMLNRILWHSVKGYDTPYPKLSMRPTAGAERWPGAPPVKDDD